jgi:hypothetical protein
MADAQPVALSLARDAAGEDRDILLDYIDACIAGARTTAALEIWNGICRRHLLPYPSSAAGTLTNGDFAQPTLNRGFDWLLDQSAGVSAAQTAPPDPSLHVMLSGRQPEYCGIASHYVAVSPERRYVLHFQYRTEDLPLATGIIWSAGSGPDCPLAAAENWSDHDCAWRASGDQMVLGLAYRRAPGTIRTEGEIRFRRMTIVPDPDSR